ncbi:MAG: hypothetical protein ACPLXM_11140 [Bacteroidales bacterium]
MKSWLYFIVFSLMLGIHLMCIAQLPKDTYGQCISSYSADASYLQEFPVKPDEFHNTAKGPFVKYSMMLSKNTVYRFALCVGDHPEVLPVMQLFNTSSQIASNFNQETGNIFKSFDFVCQKTDVYHLIISYPDGRKGNALAVLWYLKTL